MSQQVSDAGAAFMAAEPGAEPEAPETPRTEPAPVPSPAPTAAPAPEAVDETVDGAVEDKGPVPYGEHKKAKDEAARYRTELRRYEDAFAGYHPDDAAVLLEASAGAARLLAEGKTGEASKMFRAIADAFGPAAAEEAKAGAVEAADADDLLSRADVEKMLAEREQASSQAAAVERIQQEISAKAPGLGFDLTTPEGQDGWAVVLTEALHLHDGDVDKAAAAVKAREQAAVDRYLAAKGQVADSTARTVSGTDPTPAGPAAPKSITEASAALRAHLDSM